MGQWTKNGVDLLLLLYQLYEKLMGAALVVALRGVSIWIPVSTFFCCSRFRVYPQNIRFFEQENILEPCMVVFFSIKHLKWDGASERVFPVNRFGATRVLQSEI